MSREQQERERQKALLLRLIQQQRLDLSASRHPASFSPHCPRRFSPFLAHQQNTSPFSVCRHFAQHRLYDPLQPLLHSCPLSMITQKL